MRKIIVQGDTAAEYTASAMAAKKQVRLMGYDPIDDLRSDSPNEPVSAFWFGGEIGSEPELAIEWTDYTGPRATVEEMIRAGNAVRFA